MDLDDILNDESAPVAVESVEAPEIAEVAVEAPARDEHGRFASKGEETPAPTPEAAPPAAQEVEHSPPPGLIEERRKRQEAEQRANLLAQQLQQFQQAPQPQQEPYFPSVYEDEAGFAAALQQQAAQLARQQFMPEVQQQVQQVRIEIAREMMGAAHPDFAETEAAFFELARENPVLFQEMQRAPNPVRYAYDYAKKAEQVRQIGSLDIAAIEAAAIARFQASQQPASVPAPQQQIPTSLADQQSSRLNGGSAPSGPPTLDQILGR